MGWFNQQLDDNLKGGTGTFQAVPLEGAELKKTNPTNQ